MPSIVLGKNVGSQRSFPRNMPRWPSVLRVLAATISTFGGVPRNPAGVALELLRQQGSFLWRSDMRALFLAGVSCVILASILLRAMPHTDAVPHRLTVEQQHRVVAAWSK